MTTAEQNVATLRKALEAINAHRLDGLREWVASGFVRHDYDGLSIDRRGPEGLAEPVRLLLGAVPDLQLLVHDVFATEDRAVAYVSMSGTHRGEFLGAPPSGRRVCLESVDLYRLEGGKIAEAWPWPDLGGIRRSLAEPAPLALAGRGDRGEDFRLPSPLQGEATEGRGGEGP